MGEELKKKIIAVVVFYLILLNEWDINLKEKHNQINFNLQLKQLNFKISHSGTSPLI